MRRLRFLIPLLTIAAVALALACSLVSRRARAYPNPQGGNQWWVLPSTSPPTNPSWAVQNWYIDGTNSTGCASDANTGTCPTCNGCGNHFASDGPLASWAELSAHRWGCVAGGAQCPRFTSTGPFNVTLLSSISDTVYFNGAFEAAGALFSLQGIPTATQTGLSLTSVTAKNRNTPQLLQANLGANGALGQLVANSTHTGNAWAVKSLGSNLFALSQPLTGATIPPAGSPPTEVNTWATSDTVNLLTMPSVSISQWNPVSSGGPGNIAVIMALNVNTLSGGNLNLDGTMTTYVQNCNLGGTVTNENPAVGAFLFNNVDVTGTANLSQYQAGAGFPIYGGDFRNNPGKCINCAPDLDAEFLVNMSGTFPSAGFTYVDTGVTLTVFPGDPSSIASNAVNDAGAGSLWGPGALNVTGPSRFTYPAGVDGGRVAFLQTGGTTLNGATTGCVLSLDAGVTSCNVSLTPANLDTNLGAATKCFGNLGGAALCNGGL